MATWLRARLNMSAGSSLFLAQLTYMQRGETINQCVKVILQKKQTAPYSDIVA